MLAGAEASVLLRGKGASNQEPEIPSNAGTVQAASDGAGATARHPSPGRYGLRELTQSQARWASFPTSPGKRELGKLLHRSLRPEPQRGLNPKRRGQPRKRHAADAVPQTLGYGIAIAYALSSRKHNILRNWSVRGF